jgi:hypothetical protein
MTLNVFDPDPPRGLLGTLAWENGKNETPVRLVHVHSLVGPYRVSYSYLIVCWLI